ncbi:hypothetical protein HY772_04935 [Candidatus Woesearchaeota archaeon]|nr:hypothetical protein [Candidatus Woesearchaeota archaeon]
MNLEYRVVYSNLSTLALIAERDWSVTVRTSLETSLHTVHKVAGSKKIELFEKTCHPQKYSLNRIGKEVVSDNAFPYLGRKYRLVVSLQNVRGEQLHSHFVIVRKNRRAPCRKSVFEKKRFRIDFSSFIAQKLVCVNL